MSSTAQTPTGDHSTPRGDTRTGDPRMPPPDASVSDLLSRLGNDATMLFRQELALAKVELKQEATLLGKASGMLVAGAVLGFVTLLLLAWAAAWGLDAVMPTGLAFLVVAIVFGVIAAAVAAAGKKKLDQFDPTPHETIETLQEDKQTLTDRSHA